MPFTPPIAPTQLQGVTDLTLYADIKPGLIDGIFESRSYAWRMQRVLELLDAARRGSREADVLPNPFIDGVARLRGIHFFRFAIVPPGDKLFLNVTFDGGWEPYMRLIWGPLGTMLDLIFCHCEGYPLAAASRYDDYIRWVRAREVASPFLYVDSGGSVADRVYLNRLEALQRERGDRPGADLRAAHLALEALDDTPPVQPTPAAVSAALRSLKGLFGLVPLFGTPPVPNGSVPLDHGSVLLRFAQDYLADLRSWFEKGLAPAGFERERAWLMSARAQPQPQDRLPPLEPSVLQAGILDSLKAPPGRFARGALVLARVRDAAAARAWLASTGLISDGRIVELTGDHVACTVAVTCPGLLALGVHERHLASLPGEFIQGMAARAGILGDVRTNHPQQWTRPLPWQQESESPPVKLPIDLSLVHLVMQLRTCDPDVEKASDRSSLMPRLRQWIEAHLGAAAGIDVLAVEPTWSRPPDGDEPAARNHFGFVDGVSQPALAAPNDKLAWDDSVKTGELLLGWVNDRGDGPQAEPGWLDNGTFLVVRKVRQYVSRFGGVVDRGAEALVAAGASPSIRQAREVVRKKLMGRSSDGAPLVVEPGVGLNNFDYRDDGAGARCPFASHVRRANPRAALPGARVPRILRRGMAYGAPPTGNDQADRGVLFMAYNASIAEQFEVVQRWITGGNSSGVSSSQPDPFLGVPRIGEPNVFRFAHGDKVIRVDLGDQPICRLEWGLYAFVPSMRLLQELEACTLDPEASASARKPPAAATPTLDFKTQDEQFKRQPDDVIRQQVKAEFEDDLFRSARWASVRERAEPTPDQEKNAVGVPAHPGVERIGTTVMVGAFDAVMQVLKDDGSTYSVRGYGERMGQSLGLSPFGQDNVGPYAGHERPFVGEVKKAVAAAMSEADAYSTAHRITAGLLAPLKDTPVASVDFIDLGTKLIAELCRQWFGVVYGDGTAEVGGVGAQARPVRCPGHFLSAARHVFSAYPNRTVEGLAERLHGPALKEAVATWVSHARETASDAVSAPVLNAVLNAIDNAPGGRRVSADDRNGTVANVMLGLPATLLGSWGKVLRAWIVSRDLWRFQYELLQQARPAAHDAAAAVLRPALMATMAADPVADGIWRTVANQPDNGLSGVNVEAGDVVWLGLGSALTDQRARIAARNPGDMAAAHAEFVEQAEYLLFGGQGAPHACPGRGLAIGTLLGALAALLQAGEWATTASPTVLSLKPLQP